METSKKDPLRVIVVPWMGSVETTQGKEQTLVSLGAIVWNRSQLPSLHWEAQNSTAEGLKKLKEYLSSLGSDVVFLTCNPDALERHIPTLCLKHQIDPPIIPTADLRCIYSDFYQRPKVGFYNMLKELNMKPQEKKLTALSEATYMHKLIDHFISDGFTNWSRYLPGIPDSAAVVINKVDIKNLKPQQYDYFLVLDFEAQCQEGKKLFPQEIIEFPTVVVNAKTIQIENKFHKYVKPEVFPILTPFCKQLTGIQQDWVDKGATLRETLKQYDLWLKESGLYDKNIVFVTCGDWDLKSCLPNQCDYLRISVPSYFRKWVNIKRVYGDFYKKRNGSMPAMLAGLNIELTGRHHSGIDDCMNITKILQRMLQDGAMF